MLCLQCEGPDAVVVEPGDALAAAVPLIAGAELWPRDSGDVVRVTADAFETTGSAGTPGVVQHSCCDAGGPETVYLTAEGCECQ
eukprot:6014628-Alexandrium_andersonii.AAC.1